MSRRRPPLPDHSAGRPTPLQVAPATIGGRAMLIAVAAALTPCGPTRPARCYDPGRPRDQRCAYGPSSLTYGPYRNARALDLPITSRMLGIYLDGSRRIEPAHVGCLVGPDGSKRVLSNRLDDQTDDHISKATCRGRAAVTSTILVAAERWRRSWQQPRLAAWVANGGDVMRLGVTPASPRELPDGIVTFLLTDIEGSTPLRESHTARHQPTRLPPNPSTNRQLRRLVLSVHRVRPSAVYGAQVKCRSQPDRLSPVWCWLVD
jgi:hypothetical protein